MMRYLVTILFCGLIVNIVGHAHAANKEVCGHAKFSLMDAQFNAWEKMRGVHKFQSLDGIFKADEFIFQKDEEVVPGEFDTLWKVCYRLHSTPEVQLKTPECAPLIDFTTPHLTAMAILREQPDVLPAGHLLSPGFSYYIVPKSTQTGNSEIWQCLNPIPAPANIPKHGKGYYCSFNKESLKTPLEYSQREYLRKTEHHPTEWTPFHLEVILHRSLFDVESIYWRACVPIDSKD